MEFVFIRELPQARAGSPNLLAVVPCDDPLVRVGFFDVLIRVTLICMILIHVTLICTVEATKPETTWTAVHTNLSEL